MIAAEDTALVLLAAGGSLRFGAADKLAQDLHGRPLAFHAVAALAELPFAARFAVSAGTPLDFAGQGYAVLLNETPELGLSSSLRLGVAAAERTRCAAVLVALADMPCVTPAHLRRLLAAADGPAAIVASSDGARISPPAVFGRDRFPALLAAQGDAGARALVRSGRHVAAVAAELSDVDRPEDLDRLRAVLG